MELTPKDYVTLNNLEAENAQLREQLQVEQINHRQTIDRYSDEVGILKEQLDDAEDEIEVNVAKRMELVKQLAEKDKIIELLHESNKDLDDVCIRLAEAEAKVATLKRVLQDLYDLQNGAPLVRDEEDWNRVMKRAEEVLI